MAIDSKPPVIVYATGYMDLIGNKEQLKFIDEFVAVLETSLGFRHERISFDGVWKANPPSEANGDFLQEYMKDASRDSFFYEDYHSFDAFRADYKHKFGKDAYISPPVRWQWDLSSKISKEASTEASKRLEVHKEWFLDVVMHTDQRNTLVLIPIEETSARYRNELPSKHFNPVGIPNLFLSPILEAPELTVPSESDALCIGGDG
ncbi:hypothetical protein K458DRAFT_383194 [Lentithecium fluviatile CBS 122367]|uniref:Uncharacterized protein n=1 Tax=Lentithecium fluviatile CBS 122367 TaxID=1168545 RepID=A0A6G1JHN6_9PLEO|nr:hypothetical protein K458DRAFT_383194 [Lentithecium fluviatile CBS 122367]